MRDSTDRPLEDGWIDVTRPLEVGMPRWPGDPAFQLSSVSSIASGDACNVTQLSMCVHTGTHIDAPIHFIRGGAGVEIAPLSALMGLARVIQCDDPVAIRRAFLEEHQVQEHERLIIKTSTPFSSEFREDYVYIAQDAAKYLVQRRVRLIAVDTMSVGGFNNDMIETHEALLGGGVWIVENLDLGQVPAGRYEVICLHLNIPGCDGAPARVLVRPES